MDMLDLRHRLPGARASPLFHHALPSCYCSNTPRAHATAPGSPLPTACTLPPLRSHRRTAWFRAFYSRATARRTGGHRTFARRCNARHALRGSLPSTAATVCLHTYTRYTHTHTFYSWLHTHVTLITFTHTLYLLGSRTAHCTHTHAHFTHYTPAHTTHTRTHTYTRSALFMRFLQPTGTRTHTVYTLPQVPTLPPHACLHTRAPAARLHTTRAPLPLSLHTRTALHRITHLFHTHTRRLCLPHRTPSPHMLRTTTVPRTPPHAGLPAAPRFNLQPPPHALPHIPPHFVHAHTACAHVPAMGRRTHIGFHCGTTYTPHHHTHHRDAATRTRCLPACAPATATVPFGCLPHTYLPGSATLHFTRTAHLPCRVLRTPPTCSPPHCGLPFPFCTHPRHTPCLPYCHLYISLPFCYHFFLHIPFVPSHTPATTHAFVTDAHLHTYTFLAHTLYTDYIHSHIYTARYRTLHYHTHTHTHTDFTTHTHTHRDHGPTLHTWFTP